MRYFVLYEYGGLYADLDIVSLRPLDDAILKYPCFIAQEPLIHALFLYQDKYFTQPMSAPGLMGCRPGHPFFKYVIENLAVYSGNMHVMNSTGPLMLNRLAHKYIAENELHEDHEDYLFLAPSDYFLPTWDDIDTEFFIDHCYWTLRNRKRRYRKGRSFEQRQIVRIHHCYTLYREGFNNTVKNISYTDHKWQHTYIHENYTGDDTDRNIHIHNIIPYAKIVSFISDDLNDSVLS